MHMLHTYYILYRYVVGHTAESSEIHIGICFGRELAGHRNDAPQNSMLRTFLFFATTDLPISPRSSKNLPRTCQEPVNIIIGSFISRWSLANQSDFFYFFRTTLLCFDQLTSNIIILHYLAKSDK